MTGADDEAITAIEPALHALARRLMQSRLHDHFTRQAGVDIDRAGVAVLYVLHGPGSSLRITDMAAQLSIDTPGVTRKTQQLERLGLVTRCRDAADARTSWVRLTPDGRRVLCCFLTVRRQWLAELLAAWPAADRGEFARLLTRFTSDIQSRLDELNL
jgi:DNA-binding MarR family transcriptional regulator